MGSRVTTGPGGGPDVDRAPATRPDTLEIIHRPDPVPNLAEPLPSPTPSPAGAGTGDVAALLLEFAHERARRRSVRAAKALVALVALGLLAVWLLHPPRTGGSENRSAAALPTLTPGGLMGGGDYRQADAALRDRLALRQYVVKAVGETARDRMRTSLNSRVVMGPTGVPFLSEDFVVPCEHDFDPARVDAGLRELQAIGRRNGKTITVAVAPDKSSVLTDELGRRADALLACADDVRRKTQSTWGGRSGSAVLTAWSQLGAEQARHPGTVFQRGDSHWTSQGALIWSRALITHLVQQGEAPPELAGAPQATRAPDEPADDDLYRLMGTARPETVPVWRVSRPDVRIRARSVPSPSGRGVAMFRAWSSSEPMIAGRTLVVDDSFFARAEGQLAPYFSDLLVMHWADFLVAVKAGTLPAFDRIVLETVQRGWPERAGWLAAGQPVHQALAAQLAAASPSAPMPPQTPATPS